MASSLLQVRVNEELKTEAAAIYEKLGIDLPTAVRMFLKRSVQVKGIPFGMMLQDDVNRMENGFRAIHAMREEAKRSGASDMTLDEINAEIAATRAERHVREEAEEAAGK